MSRPTTTGLVALAVALAVALPPGHREGLAAPAFGPWTDPVNLGALVNTEFDESGAHTSKDGLSLYFHSNRPASYGSFGQDDLWVSQRPSIDAPWGLPMNLGPTINTAAVERTPALSRDGHYLFFASTRQGGMGGLDIWVSWRANPHDDLGWEPPVNLSAVNSTVTDAAPSFFENDEAGVPHLYMASNRAGSLDIWVSEFIGGAFQASVLIPALSTPQNDLAPSIRHDGLEIVFVSNRPGSAFLDLWAATRASVGAPWSVPVNLGAPVNTAATPGFPGTEGFPTISADRKALFFNSDRPGGFGEEDLYMSTRSGPGR
jgi:Tol biopolymer transport system component